MSAWLAGWDEAQSELTKIDHSEANPSPVSCEVICAEYLCSHPR
jgi:hypothetical protein